MQDAKLAKLLNEFNAIKDTAPNLAAIGMRTILCLILQERAKIKNPDGTLAKSDDLMLQNALRAAKQEGLFGEKSPEQRVLDEFKHLSQKDVFDIIAHKPGVNALIDPEALSLAVDTLLNRLLRTITD